MTNNKIQFDSFTNSINITYKITELSGRDKLNLMNALFNDLGITEWMHYNPEEAKGFRLYWNMVIEDNIN